MARLSFIFIVTCLFLVSCNPKPNKKSIENWKQEIRETEQNFAKMAEKKAFIKLS